MAASYTGDNYCGIDATYHSQWNPIKRRFPDPFNKHELIQDVSPDFIPLECCAASDYDIIPRIVTGTRGLNTGDDDEIAGSGEYDIIPCIAGTKTRVPDTVDGDCLSTELIIRGVSLKAIRWYQTEDGLKIDLSLDKLPKSGRKRRRVSDAASVCN